MTTSAQELKFAGDVKIVKALMTSSTGFSQNITEQIQAVSIFEDIFSPFITGNLIMKDGLDLINLFPIIGEENLELEIQTPSMENASIIGKYYVYKLSERELMGDRTQTYKLHFISREALVDINKKTSKTFAGRVEEIVPTFIQDDAVGLESRKRLIIDPTTQHIKYISNFWSPLQNIRYLTNQAVSAAGRPDFVFFENRDGFYFVSLSSLYNNPIYQEFTKQNYTREVDDNGMSVRDINADYKQIENISVPKGLDTLERTRAGAMASRQYTYDVTNKRYKVKYFNINDVWNSQGHTNENKPFSKNAVIKNASKIFTTTDFSNSFTGFDGGNEEFNHFQERVSTLFLAEDRKIEIEVPGRTDYTVGQTVKLNLSRSEPYSVGEDDSEDRVLGGKYLVAAINHFVTKERHTCYIELIKDSTVANPNGKFN